MSRITWNFQHRHIESVVTFLQLWDTAGSERYRAITSAYYRGALGAVVVYDITRRETFDNITYWLNELQKYTPESMKIVLIGNKVDLDNERQVRLVAWSNGASLR